LAYAIAPNSPISTYRPIITNGCDVTFKCRIALDNYKYVTKQTSSQTCTMLCIQFSFILR
jgi:hypothetical protein